MGLYNYKDFVKVIQKDGLEAIKLYYGIYHALVEDNDDPQRQGRLKVKVPQISDNEPIQTWAYPAGSYAGNGTGFVAVPEKGDGVWVVFKNGNPRFPVWLGGWWGSGDMPQEVVDNYLQLKIIKTVAGNKIEFDDTSGENALRLEDGNGNTIHLSTTTVKLNGEDEPAVLGDKNATTFEQTLDEISSLITQVNNLVIGLQATFTAFAGAVPQLAVGKAAFDTIAASLISQLTQINTQVQQTKTVQVPQTKSQKVKLS